MQFNTPVLKDGLLFGLSDKGMFFCLDAKTGKTDWVDTTKRGGNFAAVLDAGSVILALPSTSELIAFKPSGKAYDGAGQDQGRRHADLCASGDRREAGFS